MDKVFQGEDGLWGIGGDNYIVYEAEFETEAEAQAILDAHNAGAETYIDAVKMIRELTPAPTDTE